MVGVANQRIPHTTLLAAHYFVMSFAVGFLLILRSFLSFLPPGT
jgi:hypothetical protein